MPRVKDSRGRGSSIPRLERPGIKPGMSPKQRATEIVETVKHSKKPWNKLIILIEAAIVAAVKEDVKKKEEEKSDFLSPDFFVNLSE